MHAMDGWGRLIEEAREAAGLNKTELADRIGLDPSMVSKLESEKVFVGPDVFRKLTTELRALSPVALVNALGYTITTPKATTLPVGLVQDLLEMTPDELDAVAFLVQRRVRPGRSQARSTQ